MGQLAGHRPGILQFATLGELAGATSWDVAEVLGSLKDVPRAGFDNQGGQLIEVTDEQIERIREAGLKHLAAAAAEAEKADALVEYEDINDLLRKSGNAAAAE